MWAHLVLRDMSFLSVKMLTANMLLSAVFLSGIGAACRYSASLFITIPQKMEALSGSCLHIPCNFSSTGKHHFTSGATYGVWIKNYAFFDKRPKDVIYNSSGTVATYPMNLTGNLGQNDCTTLFSDMKSTYEDNYYFRIEGQVFRATALCNILQIKVTDSPWSPTIKISGVLKEKESVTITCSALTPCPHFPPTLTWNLLPDSQNHKEENKNQTFTTKIQETITLSDKHDGNIITCSAKYPVNEGKDVKTAEETQILNVTYAPKDTSVSISPSALVAAGEQVNLTCSSRANPPVSGFSWFMKSKDGALNVFEGEFYSFNLTKEGVFYCVAVNYFGNETSTEIHLAIKGNPDEGKIILGTIIGIILTLCLIIGLVLSCVYWNRLRSSESSQQSLYQTGEDLAAGERTGKAEEDIHYGEIDFSKRGADPGFNAGQEGRRQQETLYAEVNVPGVTQAADGSEELYAQVKKL